MSHRLALLAVALGVFAFVTTLLSQPTSMSTLDPMTRAVVSGLGTVFAVWFWAPWIQWAARQVRDFWETVRT